ncbi:Uncharacterized conserved protein YkwD, contains CAP (CSP/antigen 5/PR1) domain [Paenibacillus sp. 1_12]|uniref:stalk domain-containing protein n=1 Tax=Paenibacillus sp. 1_12 TaxID=1566278 RepID=UPI0008F4351C|nr:stalk domain-containing protein [Paenibacillus sp. 1_12]SFK75592.1 Uncharacterized conserved protein YkwD, contains CAP (CSP/antigen 5/PR1) domain [Paenibacillus sp. 1_12]
MKINKLASVAIALSVLLGGNSALAASTDPVSATSSDLEYSKEAKEALSYLNATRKKMGLKEVTLNPYLVKAAQNHADYLTANNSKEHSEVKGSKKFTGEDAKQRVAAVGAPEAYAKKAGEGLTFHVDTAIEALDTFLGSAYHRTPLVNPRLSEIGVGISGKNINFLYVAQNTEVVHSVYPYDGQTGVGVGFYGFEDPNPLTQFGLTKSGYIISFSPDYVPRIKELKATIKNSKGESIPYFTEWKSQWFLFPKTELAYNETYTISVNYVPELGADEGKTLNKTWSFTTMAEPVTTPTAPPTTGTTKPTPSGSISAVKFNKDNVGVYINGEMVTLNPTARIVDGSTFIPLRGVFEKLGSEIGWEEATQTVTITKGATIVKLTIGSTTATVNGNMITLTVAPFTIEGSTYVPLRFASESIGADVKWDAPTYTATITSSE